MSQTVQVAGEDFVLPTTGDVDWGSKFSAWAAAISDTASGILNDAIRPETYGAVGGGIADDGNAIIAAMFAAADRKLPLAFRPVTYMTRTMLPASALHGLELRGTGTANGQRTIIKAGAAMDAVFKSGSSYVGCSGILFDGNRLATHSVLLEGASFNEFERCMFQKAVKDGIHLSNVGINDSNLFERCWSYNNGRIFCTSGFNTFFTNYQKTAAAGTVATTSGSEIITGTGTSFTTMGIRSGDFLRIGSGVIGDQYLQISEVTDNTHLKVGVQKTPTANLAGQGFAISVGNGYTEERHNDNNITEIIGGQWDLNAGSAISANGLYGPRVSHVQIDISGFYGVSIGTTDQEQCYGSVLDNIYFEGCLAAPILFGCAAGFLVNLPVYDYTSAIPLYHKAATLGTQNVGIVIDHTGIKPVGTATSSVPVSISADPFLVNGRVASRAEVQSVSAAVAINPAPHLLKCSVSAPVTMTATPSILAGYVEGQEIILYNTGAGDTLTLQDNGTLAGSNLLLSANTVVLKQHESMRLMWLDGKWVQMAVGHLV